MNAKRLVGRLERFAGFLPAVLRGVSLEDARWRPADGAWSILEVVTHLADEEVEDFRTRLERTLREPSESWPPIDPQGWAVQRRYNEGDLAEALDRFVRERRASVEWLRRLDRPEWSKVHNHPKLGPIRTGDIFASWAAHDMLHLRQIAKRMFQMVQRDGGKYAADYAGTWSA